MLLSGWLVGVSIKAFSLSSALLRLSLASLSPVVEYSMAVDIMKGKAMDHSVPRFRLLPPRNNQTEPKNTLQSNRVKDTIVVV